MGLRLLTGLMLVLPYITLSAQAQAADEVLSWADCLREAARNHPDLVTAKEAVVQQESAGVIAGSGRWPQASANLNGSSAWSSRTGAGNSYGYGVSGSQLIFDGFKTANTVLASKENITVAREEYRFTSVDVRYRLRSAFVNLLKTQELQVLTRDIYKIRKSNLDLIELRYKAGMEHKGALLTARANVSQAQMTIDQAVRGLESARQQLIKELGWIGHPGISVGGALDAGVVDVQPPDLASLAANSPSLQKISAQRRAAEFSLKANQGDFWPAVSLTGGVSRSDTRWPAENQGSTAGVQVSWPLLEGGARLARLNQAKSAYRQLGEQERSIKDGIILALEQAWNGYRDAVDNVGVQKDFLAAAEERAKIARQQYTVGLVTFDNWTIIEDDLVKNKHSFLDAQAQALQAEAAWIQAKGETLEYEK